MRRATVKIGEARQRALAAHPKLGALNPDDKIREGLQIPRSGHGAVQR